jgi:hypothetical protein
MLNSYSILFCQKKKKDDMVWSEMSLQPKTIGVNHIYISSL